MDRHLTENRIRVALKADNPQAIELIWDVWAQGLFAYIQALLCSYQDAEDVLQQVFMRMVRFRWRLAQVKQLRCYVYRMAYHEAITFRTKREKQRLLPPQNDRWLRLTDPSTQERHYADKLEEALRLLPEKQRVAIVLKIYRDMTFQEMAELLELSSNTVASRYRYGMKKLARLLKENSHE
ncbi:RNA polymerase sigma factor [Planctomycetota bacterium]